MCYLETSAGGGWRSKNQVFSFAELRTVIGPKRRPDPGGSLWHNYFLKTPLVCEEMSTRDVEKKKLIIEVCSESRIFIMDIALSTSAGHN